MNEQPAVQTAVELGLMVGFPVPQDKLVTHSNQLYGPFNRWSFLNELKLNRTSDVWRGSGKVAEFDYDLQELGEVRYKNFLGAEFSFNDMIRQSYTDGIIVLHKGRVVFEQYLNGMEPHTLHAWASCSKAVVGTLAAGAVSEGLINPDEPIVTYLPELRGSGFGDASVLHAMDMTTAVGFAQPDTDPVSENVPYSIAMGWRAMPPDYTGPRSACEFLPTMVKTGEHGERFTYQTPNCDILAWILKRIYNKSLSAIMQEKLWSKLGAERDAFWIVDPSTSETSGSGLITTLRDMARFGQMLIQNGRFNGMQILSGAAVEDIEAGADKEAFARSAAAGPSNIGYSYHHQWWNTHDGLGAYYALGYGGQILYIAPAAEMVVAKFSSYPTPTPAGNEFYAALGAIPALGRRLMEKNS